MQGPNDAIGKSMSMKTVKPELAKTASGILIPKGTIEKIVQSSQIKARPRRPSRKEVRAFGNTRVKCKKCQTPVKLKNFASHASRLHPESDTAKQVQADAKS